MNFLKAASIVTAMLSALPTFARKSSYEGFNETIEYSCPTFGCSDALCCIMPTGFGVFDEFDTLGAVIQSLENWGSASENYTHMLRVHFSRSFNPIPKCASPDYFRYVRESGHERTIKVPIGEAQTVADLYLACNLTALAIYEDYIMTAEE